MEWGKDPIKVWLDRRGLGRLDGYERERLDRCEWKKVTTPIILRFADDCFAQVRLSVPIEPDQVRH